MILSGAIPAALLALLVDILLAGAERAVVAYHSVRGGASNRVEHTPMLRGLSRVVRDAGSTAAPDDHRLTLPDSCPTRKIREQLRRAALFWMA
jgi:hypothetical protein